MTHSLVSQQVEVNLQHNEVLCHFIFIPNAVMDITDSKYFWNIEKEMRSRLEVIILSFAMTAVASVREVFWIRHASLRTLMEPTS